MIVLRLAAGGRVALRAVDVAAVQASPWGAIVLLASNGSKFEVEHSVDEIVNLIPSLWFRAPETAFNPDMIASIWEESGKLYYRLEGGLEMTQDSADLHQFIEAINLARAQRLQTGGAHP